MDFLLPYSSSGRREKGRKAKGEVEGGTERGMSKNTSCESNVL